MNSSLRICEELRKELLGYFSCTEHFLRLLPSAAELINPGRQPSYISLGRLKLLVSEHITLTFSQRINGLEVHGNSIRIYSPRRSWFWTVAWLYPTPSNVTSAGPSVYIMTETTKKTTSDVPERLLSLEASISGFLSVVKWKFVI